MDTEPYQKKLDALHKKTRRVLKLRSTNKMAYPCGWANRARKGGTGREGPGTVGVEAGLTGARVTRVGKFFDASMHFLFQFFFFFCASSQNILPFPSMMRHTCHHQDPDCSNISIDSIICLTYTCIDDFGYTINQHLGNYIILFAPPHGCKWCLTHRHFAD